MKAILRIFTFCGIALYVTQYIINGFEITGETNITIFLVLTAIALLYLFAPLIFKLISLPSEGLGSAFLLLVLTTAVFFVLATLLPTFSVIPTAMPELLIFGVVLPSKNLSATESLLFSALVFVLIVNFLRWLCVSKN